MEPIKALEILEQALEPNVAPNLTRRDYALIHHALVVLREHLQGQSRPVSQSPKSDEKTDVREDS